MADQQQLQMISTAVASSSNSSKKFDVFLSFRGEDTRWKFTSYLYEALKQKKIETFIDWEIKKGDKISQALNTAIEDSYISVVILSENYASSKWCLGELCKILECNKYRGQIVIPVFYEIEPTHVKNQTGSYEKAFAEYKEDPRYNNWKAALTEVGKIVGHVSQAERPEPEFVKDIVNDVWQKLARILPNQQLNGLVGIDQNYDQVETLLRSWNVTTLGIWGMGGIGKTTLATALYNKLSHEFEGCCFLKNVRENSNKLGDLRHELFSELFGNTYKMNRLSRKKAFIVLDDVDTPDQLEKLILECDFFLDRGSKVIVTTRNKGALTKVDRIHEVEQLFHRHSLDLFYLTVFGEKRPKDGYEELSKEVVSYCKNVPLAIKVVGARLCSTTSKKSWKSELEKLKNIQNWEIHKVLKLSYDGLERTEKYIFLDIACFFKGKRRECVTNIMEAFKFHPIPGIKTLLDKALITISSDCIEMHDLIQEMGWEIVKQVSSEDLAKQSRLWKPEDVRAVLKQYKGKDIAAEGIIINLDELTEDLSLDPDFLAKMDNLRFLEIDCPSCFSNKYNVKLDKGLASFPCKLMFLHWNVSCLECLPSNCVEELVELYMPRSKLKKLWDGKQNLVNLKEIELFRSEDLIEMPDLTRAEKLERVSLMGCKSLQQFDQSNLHSLSLTCLDLRECEKMKSLTVHSKPLPYLDLTGCSSLKKITITSQEIRELNLSSCREIESLNLNLKSLVRLNLTGCSSLKKITITSQKIRQLELPPTLGHLNAYNCISLKKKLTPELVFQHMLQSFIPNLHPHSSDDEEFTQEPVFQHLYDDDDDIDDDDIDYYYDDDDIDYYYDDDEEFTQEPVFQHLYDDDDDIDYYYDDDDIDYFYDDDDAERPYFLLPGGHVNHKECGFHTESSITIAALPMPQLRGFIYCGILPKGSVCMKVSVSIYQDGIKVGWDFRFPRWKKSISISDHVMFWYHDISKFNRISQVHDHLRDITFKFERSGGDLKGFSVFPVYAKESGLQLEIFESESNDREQLPAQKRRRRTSPEMIKFL